ncbi:MAG: hypothetical protein KAT88_09725 [Spirochaetes bacterium]|nr:hypothetical protein [Spirochaetota bacterium]
MKMTGGMSWDTLTRMSSDGTVLEVQSGTEKLDPDSKQYSIYNREKSQRPGLILFRQAPLLREG